MNETTKQNKRRMDDEESGRRAAVQISYIAQWPRVSRRRNTDKSRHVVTRDSASRGLVRSSESMLIRSDTAADHPSGRSTRLKKRNHQSKSQRNATRSGPERAKCRVARSGGSGWNGLLRRTPIEHRQMAANEQQAYL